MDLLEQSTSEKNFTLEEMTQAAHWLIGEIGKESNIWKFYGPMGAGKTTLIKNLCQAWGVTEETSSPTYSLVNEYLGTEGSIYHFDFYRLEHVEEALEIGVEDYLYQGKRCLIEWPELVEDLLPSNAPGIEIQYRGENARTITIRK
jgi:tRNA threonylcarbamoyladenosine biosynthesis protein TsaE